MPVTSGIVPFVLYDEIAAGSPQFGTAVWTLTESPGQDLSIVTGRGDALNSIDYMDPEPSPDGTQIVYSSTPISAGSARVLVAPVAGGGGTIIATNPSTLVTSMEPWWHPTDNLVCYRTLDDSPNEASVRTCDPSVGVASEVILKTVSRTTVGDIVFPRFSPSGDYIAYLVDSVVDSKVHLWVMNADGTGAADIATVGPSGYNASLGWEFSWANLSDTLAYQTISAAKTQYRKINANGTGDALIWTDPNFSFYGVTKRSWTSDDTGLMVFSRISTTVDPQFQMYRAATDGSGAAAVSPAEYSYMRANDHLAFVYGDRVYWQDADTLAVGDDHAVLVSCAFDGSDKRTEFSCDPPPTGYTSIQWTGAFEAFLNQST